MKANRWFFFVLLFQCIPYMPLHAAIDIIGGPTLSIPTGDMRKYSYGSVGVGATVRLATNVSKYAKFFVQGTYSDFGLETGYAARDNIYSDSELESVTDQYTFSIIPGISIGRNFDGLVPYFNLAGGIKYYSSLSRISSLEFSGISKLMEYNGVTWRAGCGAGLRVSAWRAKRDGRSHLLDEMMFDLRFDYFRNGEIEFLDNRSIRFKANELQYATNTNSGGYLLINTGFLFKF